MSTVDIAIVGSGISGLVAAYECRKKNLSSIIIEKNPFWGGCIRTTTKNGYILEQGANTLALNEASLTLLEELHLTSSIIHPVIPQFRQYIWDSVQNKPQALPRSPVALLQTSFFSWREKAQILKGLFRKRHPFQEETVEQFFGALIGADATQKAIQPALRGIFGGDTSLLVAKKTFPGIYQALLEGNSLFSYLRKKAKRKIFTLKEGNATLIERLREHIGSDSFKADTVTGISKDDGSFIVTLQNQPPIKAGKVLIASSGRQTAQIIQTLTPELSSDLAALQYAPIAVLHFLLEEPINSLAEGFGVLFPFSSESKIIGVLCNSTLFPHTAPAGKALITVCLGGVHNERIADLSEQELIAIARSELLTFFGVTTCQHLLTTIWPAAIPQFTKQSLELESRFIEAETSHPGLFFIGVDRGGIGVPDRIEYVRSRINLLSDFLPYAQSDSGKN